MLGSLLFLGVLAFAPDTVEFSGPPGSGKPSLAVGQGGRVILTWLEPTTTDRHALRFAVRSNGRWSAPATIRESDRFFVNWADFPSLVETTDGQWVVHWLEKTVAKPYAYHVMLSVSRDQGRTWGEPFPAHRDRSDTEHGFVSLLPRPGGGVDVVWLDGRNLAGEERGDMTVRTVTLDVQGRLGAEIELDPRSCECCQARIARTSGGLVAAYRDRSPGEIRDIAVVRQEQGKWSAPVVPAADGWEHRACPVNGPALVAEGNQVTLVWYTAVKDQPRVYVVRSTDGARSFGQRSRVDGGATLGRVDAVPVGGGQVAVAWLESVGEAEAEWRTRLVGADGRLGPPRPVVRVGRARLAGFPRMAWTGRDLLLGITATGPAGGIRILRTPLPPAPGR
jgi:hypothetical protein